MTDDNRLDRIEFKLAHLERALAELNDVVVRQQREIALLASLNRALKSQLEALDAGGSAGTVEFEIPPHY